FHECVTQFCQFIILQKDSSIIQFFMKSKLLTVHLSDINDLSGRYISHLRGDVRSTYPHTLGLDIQSIPRARGTARLIFCSPYCKRRSSERTAISAPNSSAIAIRAMPRTAGPWCVSPFSRCCEQMPRSF